MCADWFLLRRGQDPAASLRGQYTTEVGASRIIRRYGGLVHLFARKLEPLGAVRALPENAARGDIVVSESVDGLHPGIVIGEMLMFAGAVRGVMLRNRALARVIAAWRI